MKEAKQKKKKKKRVRTKWFHIYKIPEFES